MRPCARQVRPLCVQGSRPVCIVIFVQQNIHGNILSLVASLDHTRPRPWRASHKKLCTCQTSAGSPGSLCAITMLAFCLRSPRKPRLQRLTQCFIARTEHTSSTPKPAILKQRGAVRSITYGSAEPWIAVHTPRANDQDSRRPALDRRRNSTPTSFQRGQMWKPKQSHSASSLRLHALRSWPKTSHVLPAASIDHTRGAGGWNGLGGLTKGGPGRMARGGAGCWGKRRHPSSLPQKGIHHG